MPLSKPPRLLLKPFKAFLCVCFVCCGFHTLFSMNQIGQTLSSNITFRHDIVYKSNVSSRLSVCMMLPVTSRGITHNTSSGLRMSDLPLVHTFIPSLLETIEDEYDYRLYVGYDYDDPWYDNNSNWRDLLDFFENSVKKTNRSALSIKMHPTILYGIDQRITAIWNTLAAAAYKDLCDYFYPANDDVKILTKGWTSAAIHILKTCPVASNFGIAAFKDLSACEFPTFHLTHRTHLDLHDGFYYPLPSHGAHQDPWIFSMYRAWNCSFFLPQYELTNHVGISVKARYDYGPEQLIHWIERARIKLYNRLLSSPTNHYNQSFVNYSTLNSNTTWLVPC